MVFLIVIGAVLAIGGLGGVLWCIRRALWMKKATLDDEAAKAEINRLMLVHMGSIGAAFLGIGVLVAGVLLK